eukprot:3242883-Pyramimonas_sp.AAC.1
MHASLLRRLVPPCLYLLCGCLLQAPLALCPCPQCYLRGARACAPWSHWAGPPVLLLRLSPRRWCSGACVFSLIPRLLAATSSAVWLALAASSRGVYASRFFDDRSFWPVHPPAAAPPQAGRGVTGYAAPSLSHAIDSVRRVGAPPGALRHADNDYPSSIVPTAPRGYPPAGGAPSALDTFSRGC